jgi:hypothetical protein
MKGILTLLGVATLAMAGGGCAGPSGEAKTADAGAYEWVTPLGSNIPVRVPKGQGAASTTSPTATLNGEQATNAISSAGGGSVNKTGTR